MGTGYDDVPVTQPEVLLSLLSFCTACSIHGVQTRECGHTSRSPLDSLESAIGFHMRDWWQPTKANFFGHLKKPQIIAALNEAGLSGAARDAEKMKKGDAAEHAEHNMKDNRWVRAGCVHHIHRQMPLNAPITWLMPPDEQPHRPAGDGAAARRYCDEN